jgi:SAM-dependent methyltransferase
MNALRRFTTSLEQKGVRRTARLVVKYVGVAASRAGDHWFDLRYGTDTSGIIEVEHLEDVKSPNKRFAMRYEVTRARPLRRLLRLLDLPTGGVFVDIGCGKGRVLMVAAAHGFERIVGVEYSHELCEVARRNLSVFRDRTGRGFDAEVVECDAVDYDIPGDANVFFLFNPFYSEILELVAWKIARSVAEHPRKVWLIYLYPECRAAFDGNSAFAEAGRYVWGDCEFVVYENRQRAGAD